jgi:hypothetical protein
MQVVDDAYIVEFEFPDDGDLVLRFTEPATVVIQPDFAADSCSRLGNGANAIRFLFDPITLLIVRLRNSPELDSRYQMVSGIAV